MARIDEYRNHIEELLNEYASYKTPYGDIENETIFDRERDHYQLVSVGWDKNERVVGTSFHLDIKDGKIWIQQDNTDARIAEELVARGVPKEHIVLAFQAPYKRKYSGFAEN